MFSSTMSHVIYVAPQPSQVILPCQDLCPAVAPPLIFDCYKYVPCKCCDDWVHKKRQQRSLFDSIATPHFSANKKLFTFSLQNPVINFFSKLTSKNKVYCSVERYALFWQRRESPALHPATATAIYTDK